jgi:hypothetical protein
MYVPDNRSPSKNSGETHTHTHTLFLHVRPASQPTKVDTFSKRGWTPLRSTTRCVLSMFVAGHVQLCDAITVVNKSRLKMTRENTRLVVCRRPLTAEARVRSWVNPRGICFVQSGNETGSSPSTSAVPFSRVIPPALPIHISFNIDAT